MTRLVLIQVLLTLASFYLFFVFSYFYYNIFAFKMARWIDTVHQGWAKCGQGGTHTAPLIQPIDYLHYHEYITSIMICTGLSKCKLVLYTIQRN